MSILAASIILTIIASTYAVLLKRQLAETFFLAVVTVIAVLYCFGLINIGGCLLYGIYGLIVFTLGCIIFLLYYFVKDRKLLIRTEILQGCLLYTGLLVISLFINSGQVFHNWDEFSHWGTIVKYFYHVDAMGTFDNHKFQLLFPAYFPGTSLFQYFFSRFSSQFIEYCLYVAMNILYFSLFMPFIKDIFKNGKRVKLLILLIMFLLIPMQNFGFYGGFYSSVYVDAILGAFFGFALLYYFVYKYEESSYGILMVSAAVVMLTLTKDMGLLFSLGIIGIIFSDIILYRRTQMLLFVNGKPKLQSKSKAAILIVLPLISTLFVKFSWENLLHRAGIASIWRIPTLTDIYMLVTKQAAPYQNGIPQSFFNAMQQQAIVNNITVISFCVLFLVIIAVFLIFGRIKVKFGRMVTASILLVAGIFIYQFVLMIIYVFSFSEYEAVRLASYERYTSTYVLAMMFFMMVFYISDQNEYKKTYFEILIGKIKRKNAPDDSGKYKDISKLIYSLMGIVLCSYVYFNTQTGSYGMANTFLARWLHQDQFRTRPTAIAVNRWRSYFIDSKPYLLVQGEDGYNFYRIKSELCPDSDLANKPWAEDYNIAPEAPDVWTFAVSPEEWEKYVLSNKFEIIYVYQSNEQLGTTYGHFFPYGVQDDMLYRVQNNDGHLSLIPVIQYF